MLVASPALDYRGGDEHEKHVAEGHVDDEASEPSSLPGANGTQKFTNAGAEIEPLA